MEIKKETEDEIKYYNVEYNTDKLKELLNKLKEYKFTEQASSLVGGKITSFPINQKIAEKRTVKFFYKKTIDDDAKIDVNSIKLEKNKITGGKFIRFDYSYSKYPDIFYLIDILANDKNILEYINKMESKDIFRIDLFSVLENSKGKVIEAILEYGNSEELENLSKKDGFDYKGLLSIYNEVLKTFELELTAVKSNVQKQKKISAKDL